MKRIVTIQDISCLGRCSLTVALPIISSMGVECCIVPTAVLSTHTMIPDFTFKDLTDQIAPIEKHWKNAGFSFDAVYTGYLGSAEQIDLVSNFFDSFRGENTVIVVDPVMGDNGRLYPAFDLQFAGQMAKLCARADIILPNLTEAAFLTGCEYRESYDEAYIKSVLIELSKLGASKSVLTGVSFEEGRIGVMGYDSSEDSFFSYFTDRLPDSYHGTGDIFASTFTGALMNGLSVEESLKTAVDYTAKTIEFTLKDADRRNYGVNFEEAIPYLLNRIGK